ncbi:MAG: hypothetical protein FWH31_02305 [Streptococcaceae bacterium]|nr:hypothetical protein [Streptococcaceae bacterium]
MNDDLKLPPVIVGLQVVLSALSGAIIKLLLQNYSWVIQLIAFIIVFVIVYIIVGMIYLKWNKNRT